MAQVLSPLIVGQETQQVRAQGFAHLLQCRRSWLCSRPGIARNLFACDFLEGLATLAGKGLHKYALC